MTTIPDNELLRGLDAGAARRIEALGFEILLREGAALFTLGTPAEELFVIDTGRVSLTLPMQCEGREVDLLVEEKTAGQMVGWSALIPPHRFTLKATAAVETRLLAFPRAALLDHFAAHPDVAYGVTCNIARIVGQRLQVFQAMWLRQMQRLVEQHAA
jgi:CRP-like cAMP-binding protein